MVESAKKAGALGAAQNMIGETVHAIVHEDNANSVAEAFKQTLPSQQVIVSKIDSQGARPRKIKNSRKFAVGGTFDELHMGHKTLLGRAFEVGDKVIIGLSSNEFVSKMSKPHVTASYNERRKELNTFLEQSGLVARAENSCH